MKIVSLTAENVKRLVAVEITPAGNLVQITGKNGQGKTSVLDSIWWALAGASHIQAVPIRNGSDRALIRLDLGDIIVTRKFERKGEDEYTSTIAVENADGARFPTPQKMIDSLLGELTFDPLAFARAKPKEQFDALRQFAPDVDFEAIEKAHKADFERRTEINRFAKEARASASMIVVPSNTPSDPIDESALVDELTKAGEHNAQLEQRKARRQKFASDIDLERQKLAADELRIRELQEEIGIVQGRVDMAATQIQTMEKQLAEAGALPDPIDTAEVRKKIEDARAINANVRKLVDRVRQTKLAVQYEDESKALSEQIDARQVAKRNAIAAAKMPIEGLELGDGVVLLNGVPLDQASDAEQLRASVAVAAAMNPKLRVIRVRDGSLLDEDGMKLLAEIADKADMQIWVERVESSGKIGFVLEAGQLKASETEAVAA